MGAGYAICRPALGKSLRRRFKLNSLLIGNDLTRPPHPDITLAVTGRAYLGLETILLK
jgi:hypothetical protein